MVENQMTLGLTFVDPLVQSPTWDIVDSSKLSVFMDCPRRFFFEYILGWRSEQKNNHLIFGHAWHKAMEHLLLHGYSKPEVSVAYELFEQDYRQHFPLQETDELFEPKTPFNAFKALCMYALQYASDMYEFSTEHTEIGGRISLSEDYHLHFRMDSLNTLRDGTPMSLEHKTTGSASRQWVDQWSLSLQVGTYTHVMKCLFPNAQSVQCVVNGTIFQKTKIDFKRVPVHKRAQHMSIWLNNTLSWVEMLRAEYMNLAACRESDSVLMAFPMNTGSCTKYFGCPYHVYCCAWPNPLQQCDQPPTGMIVEHWNPMDEEIKHKVEV